MSEVIQFLDAIGRNPSPSPAGFAAAVGMLQIDADQKQALLDRDQLALAALLHARPKMYCYINAPGNDDPEPMQDDDGDVPEQEE
ncbi:MAG: hypothetical protein M3Q11_04860 [Pseudomonadota bacterium]|nr:hypothetical protein [Pseudomonadota bacterium]